MERMIKDEVLEELKKLKPTLNEKLNHLIACGAIDPEKDGAARSLPLDIICAIARDVDYMFQPSPAEKERTRRINRFFNAL